MNSDRKYKFSWSLLGDIEAGRPNLGNTTRLEVFPEFKGNEAGTLISVYRHREGLTQTQLSVLTGIPHRRISEIESDKRVIDKESGGSPALRLQEAHVNCEHFGR